MSAHILTGKQFSLVNVSRNVSNIPLVVRKKVHSISKPYRNNFDNNSSNNTSDVYQTTFIDNFNGTKGFNANVTKGDRKNVTKSDNAAFVVKNSTVNTPVQRKHLPTGHRNSKWVDHIRQVNNSVTNVKPVNVKSNVTSNVKSNVTSTVTSNRTVSPNIQTGILFI